ncbi:hypothetical protein LPB86_04230 [Pedobacter sp. MC2016-14]|uniref:hypothetical protein n=1 Tax=Pedobacter sp. MC2016-14 TaxID=2897327 RepID=UPI001E5EFDF3|nr:hypothetical protein [Pedobacter sp. MC2016-14]MCD0487422.1 hypothetical protein [Pedobacter sp. MC2016-14]
MLKIVVYINIALSVLYLLIWLQNGSGYAIIGMLVVMGCCACLLLDRKDVAYWPIIKLFIAIPVLFAAGFLLYSGIVLIQAAMLHGYSSLGLITLYCYSFVFSVALLFQVILSLIARKD